MTHTQTFVVTVSSDEPVTVSAAMLRIAVMHCTPDGSWIDIYVPKEIDREYAIQIKRPNAEIVSQPVSQWFAEQTSHEVVSRPITRGTWR